MTTTITARYDLTRPAAGTSFIKVMCDDESVTDHFLSESGYDGAVEEGQSVCSSQHPQPQGHWKETGELPEGLCLSRSLSLAKN